jgi:hypothetical protein
VTAVCVDWQLHACLGDVEALHFYRAENVNPVLKVQNMRVTSRVKHALSYLWEPKQSNRPAHSNKAQTTNTQTSKHTITQSKASALRLWCTISKRQPQLTKYPSTQPVPSYFSTPLEQHRTDACRSKQRFEVCLRRMICIILAAGVGSRLETELESDESLRGLPRALLPVNGKPLLDYWWASLSKTREISSIYVVTSAAKYKHFERWGSARGLPLRNLINTGATSRETQQGAAKDLDVSSAVCPAWSAKLALVCMYVCMYVCM